MPENSNLTLSGRFFIMLQNQASADFAMVMSTGIVSIASHLLGFQPFAYVLFYINIILYFSLVALFAIRFVVFYERFMSDFKSHGAGVGFLTFVAGSGILGNQFVLLGDSPFLGYILFVISVVAWFFILWSVFYNIFTNEPKPPIEKGINGAWLVATVSTQAICVLGCILINHINWDRDVAFFLFTALFTLGFVLYLIIITMIFYRFAYKPMEASQMSPTYWINAGAVAITALAGSELLSHANASTVLMEFFPFIKGITIMAWSVATFWAIMLFMLMFWRYVVKRYSLGYTPEYWGMVFPLGMYTACSFMFAKSMNLEFLFVVPEYFFYIAMTAWLIVFAQLLVSRAKQLFVGE